MEKINSLYFKTEINAAFSNNAVIVPVYIDDVKENLPMEFNFYLKNVKGIDVKGGYYRRHH